MTTRMDHIAKHLRGTQNPDELLAMLPMLASTRTLDEIASEMGAGWTRRQVEHRLSIMEARLCLPTGTGRGRLARHALALLFYGIEPCWCEQ